MIDYSKLIYYEPNSKYSFDEKCNGLKEAIENGGFYDKYNNWNSIIYDESTNRILRGRVETLVIKYDKFIYLRFLPKSSQSTDLKYLIPGGSYERNLSHIEQAVNECHEEAKFDVKDIQYTGIVYTENRVPPKKSVINNKVNWNGLYNEVYIARYNGEYTDKVAKIDEDNLIATGKFYNLYKVYSYLKPEHQRAIELFYPNKFNHIYNKKFSSIKNIIPSKDFGIPSQRRFPIYDKYHLLKSIENFNSVDFFHEKELAYNITKRIKLFDIDMDLINISTNNRLRKYL